MRVHDSLRQNKSKGPGWGGGGGGRVQICL